MSLSSALSIAQSSLLNVGRQTSVVSRNVLEASNPDYTPPHRRRLPARRPARASSRSSAPPTTSCFARTSARLSHWSGQSALSRGMDRLGLAVNGVDNARPPASAIGKLQEALQLYSASPSNRTSPRAPSMRRARSSAR